MKMLLFMVELSLSRWRSAVARPLLRLSVNGVIRLTPQVPSNESWSVAQAGRPACDVVSKMNLWFSSGQRASTRWRAIGTFLRTKVSMKTSSKRPPKRPAPMRCSTRVRCRPNRRRGRPVVTFFLRYLRLKRRRLLVWTLRRAQRFRYKEYTSEATLYDVAKNELVWSGTIKTTDPENVQTAIKSYIAAVMKALEAQNLLPKR